MEKVLESGAVLNLSMCSFAEGNRLMKTVARELKNTHISMDMSGDSLKNLITGFLSSDDIEAALWPCIERGTYTVDDKILKINRDLFENEKARADYIPILKEALVFNLSPFFKNLRSLVQDLTAANTSIPKSGTPSTTQP